ncbi:hypothetical protein CK203_026568 [Vitis vinifera]|uniref:Uncharacterized protein n=1 Tax=Vitis vinifera TaxID=29760 RepID=A0A438IUJ3_VITVI|nr:hypothetical protein CK203_026568 [Vitis vinifera]
MQERVFSAIDVVNLGHILTDPKPEDGSHLLPTWETGNKQVRHAILTQCRHRKRTKKSNSKANLAETEVIIAVISSEVSMVTNMKDWVVDLGLQAHLWE